MTADAERVVDELSESCRPEDVEKVDRQFADKLERLEKDGSLKPDSLRKLRALWALLRRAEPEVPWQAKAVAMAALAYFVAPFDAVPDVAGRLGYLDDMVVIGICYRRVTRILGAEPPAP